MRALILFLGLEGFFLLLSGQFGSTFLMVAGVICCAATTLIAVHMGVVDEEGVPYRYLLRSIAYAPWLWWQIMVANIDVAKLVWSPKMAISPRMIQVPHELRSSYGIVTYANSITLTPGTVTVVAGPEEFTVHALTKKAADDLLSGTMHERVKRVEGQDS